MSEEIKTEPIEDEENLKTTPERQSILDYKNANRKQDAPQTSIQSNVGTGPDVDNIVEVKADPEVEIGLNNVVAKEYSNDNVIQTLVAGTTMEEEQPKTPEKVKTTELTRKARYTNASDKGSVQTSIAINAGNENINESIKLNSNIEANKSPSLEKSIQNTNPLENTCFNIDNENDEAKNSTALENQDVDVKTKPKINENDTIDFDVTLARPQLIRNGQNVAHSQILETLVTTGKQDKSLNEPMDLVDNLAVPALTASDTQPPPPPTISAAMDPIDGTTTPRITVAPMSRLRVKTELCLNQTPQLESETYSLPQDFFEDLLNIDKRSESGELSPDNSSQDEPIPDNFFDDLLRDKLKERIEEAQNDELEEKFSDRLKELKRLHEKSRERKRRHKKQRKSKKKSHKRSRSRSSSPPTRENHRDRKKRSSSPNNLNNKRSRLTTTTTLQEQPSISNYGNLNKVTKDAGNSTVTSQGIQVKSEFRAFEKSNEISVNRDVDMVFNPEKAELPVVNCEDYAEVEEILTPKQKRERAVMRAASLISHLTMNMLSDKNSILSTFQYTSTVRKLPASQSYVNQQIYENRSPLHTVNNVNYKFNSHATRFNMEEWGLAALPTHAAKIAKLIGCDAVTIHNKLKTIKIPAKLQKIKSELNDQEEVVMETSSSFFCNAMTQTDDVEELEQLKTKGYEIGVQVEPSVCDMGCQTLETQSPTNNNQSAQDELPIMKIMHDLNENQLMAIHDFAELIKEPAANAMDMYALRKRMLEIYKCSQLPSALATPPTQVINNYTTSKPHRRAEQMQQPIIQSVSSADGTNFTINDPRMKSAAYTSRGLGNSRNGAKDSLSNYDPRYSAFTQPHSNISPSSSESRYSSTSASSRHRASTTTQQASASSSSGKYYGRGGLRR